MSFSKIGQGVLLWLSGFCAFSCSVREDRSDCPCSLTLDLRELSASVPEDAFPVRWQLLQGDWSDSGLLSEDDCTAGLFHVVVPRGGAQVYAVTGDEGMFDHGLEIAPGHGCPPVRLWTAAVDARGETATAVVCLHKAYCRLTIHMHGAPAPRPYRLILEGNVCGWDASGYPLPGSFRCSPEPIPEQDYAVNLPRQTDDSLLLHICAGDASNAPGGAETTPLRTFALGHIIASAGYDWTAPDLPDLSLELDFAASSLSLRSDRWTRTLPFEITL